MTCTEYYVLPNPGFGVSRSLIVNSVRTGIFAPVCKSAVSISTSVCRHFKQQSGSVQRSWGATGTGSQPRDTVDSNRVACGIGLGKRIASPATQWLPSAPWTGASSTDLAYPVGTNKLDGWTDGHVIGLRIPACPALFAMPRLRCPSSSRLTFISAPPKFQHSLNSLPRIPSTILNARRFHASITNMTVTAWFDVQWTDPELDRVRSDAERAGNPIPPRKQLPFFLSRRLSSRIELTRIIFSQIWPRQIRPVRRHCPQDC